MLLLVTDIKWDTDGESLEDCALPLSVIVLDAETTEEDYLDNEVSEALSDAFGFCHNGYQVMPFNGALQTCAGGGFFPDRLATMFMERF